MRSRSIGVTGGMWAAFSDSGVAGGLLRPPCYQLDRGRGGDCRVLGGGSGVHLGGGSGVYSGGGIGYHFGGGNDFCGGMT